MMLQFLSFKYTHQLSDATPLEIVHFVHSLLLFTPIVEAGFLLNLFVGHYHNLYQSFKASVL